MIGLMIMNKELIIKELDRLFPDANCELNYNHDYELVIAVMLSAQTTDKRVNMVTKPIFEKYDTLEKLNTLTIPEIEKYIKSLGFYKTKAKNFKGIVSGLNEIGHVPCVREDLEKLPGVGRKTASVILSHLYNIPSFAVDTHVYRVSKRLGITKEKDDVLKTEMKLKKYFDKDTWNRINSQLVLFGRYNCKSINPNCSNCNLQKICKKKSK